MLGVTCHGIGILSNHKRNFDLCHLSFSNSEISVYGIVNGDINNKTIDLINGIVKVEVNEQFDKKFS